MRYIIGIDLGTTNSCVAYVDTKAVQKSIQLFKIPQVVLPGSVQALPTLPSFCYICSNLEFPKGLLSLPWTRNSETRNSEEQIGYFVGSYAKTYKDKVPTRLVHSAKSWLSHQGSSRQDKIIPIEAEDESIRISPVEATSRYLKHIKDAWNEVMLKGNSELEFNAQEIILTVPASFDEVARSLTMEAAKKAGFSEVTFLEEPQAAFYSWIEKHEKISIEILNSGDKILVCDVGGGTTDFSLINVTKTCSELSFTRMAVGDHLLLGGDNMDAMIAGYIEKKLSLEILELSLTQRLQLLYFARNAKEQLLENDNNEIVHVVLQGRGSQVVAGTIATQLEKKEIEEILKSGFFCYQPFDSAIKLTKPSGLMSMGLPFESEPSIIKHLAHFLSESGDKDAPVKPDYILFNGGAMKPLIFQEAIIDALKRWFPEKRIQSLSSYDLKLAVSRGAAYFGKARRGFGVRIGGGLPRSYYMIVETKNKDNALKNEALTLVPRGAVEGDRFEPQLSFMLQPNTAVSFQLYSSHVRLNDRVGDIVEIEPETMHSLPPMHTALKYGKKATSGNEPEKIPVHLEAALTEIGTLEIRLKSLKTDHRWLLEFQVKRASGQESNLLDTGLDSSGKDGTIGELFDAGLIKNAEGVLLNAFLSSENFKPKFLSEMLEKAIGMTKKEWPTSVNRALFDCLLKDSSIRNRSLSHKEKWWNLLGFFMRPGFGYPADDFRIKELWKLVLKDQTETLPQELKIQIWICYRRIAGGLAKGQQMQLGIKLIGDILSKRSGKIEIKSRGDAYAYSEKVRALSAMELLDISIKERLGKAIVERIISGAGTSADYWALGRIGARHLLYGLVLNVVPVKTCEIWIHQLLKVRHTEEKSFALLMEQLARKTIYHDLNVSDSCIDSILNKFSGSSFEVHLSEILSKETQLTKQEQEIVFGDYLPVGLSVV